MPWCHNCKSEYQEGVETCPDCGLPLKSAPGLSEVPYNETDWQTVYRAPDSSQAEAISALLESDGITAKVRDSQGALKSIYGGGVFDGNVEIFVMKEKLEEASRIIENRIQWSDSELTEYMKKKGELVDEWKDEDDDEKDSESGY